MSLSLQKKDTVLCFLEETNLYSHIKICDLANYADDNTLDNISSIIETVLSALQKDTRNVIKWVEESYMQANPIKFQFMFMKKYRSKEILPEF